MEPVATIVGRAAPLPRANVDTDQIIPKQFLKRVERSGFGEYLFYDWAGDAEGELDPNFVLNMPAYAESAILVAGPNFGSGSSREHAPWALEDWGFRAIVSSSFADIFATNCTKIGLLPIVLTEPEVVSLLEIAGDPTNTVTVDLETQTVSARGFEATFSIDPFTKHCLLNGLDHVALSLEHSDDISSFEQERPGYLPTVHL
ncbi:MAG: 3-isopropylmalate dehydratase small subunit [Acidimicrobiia bacterium]|nr:MAG: 3-isopropylmalate dehydratase small subunit [Acidimicrobiia bacterium]